MYVGIQVRAYGGWFIWTNKRWMIWAQEGWMIFQPGAQAVGCLCDRGRKGGEGRGWGLEKQKRCIEKEETIKALFVRLINISLIYLGIKTRNNIYTICRRATLITRVWNHWMNLPRNMHECVCSSHLLLMRGILWVILSTVSNLHQDVDQVTCQDLRNKPTLSNHWTGQPLLSD